MQKHSEIAKVINQVVDDETDWYHLNEGDNQWTHLVECWNHTKEKYLEYVKNKEVVVTAGGYIGLYVRFYSKLFKRVYAFEPHPLHFYCMVNNAQTDNVIKIQAALGDTNKLVKMEGHTSMSLQAKENVQDSYIPMFTIDSLALDKCDLIQLDVENHEYKALLGATQTISRYSPTLILENGNTEEIKNFLQSIGYIKIDTVQADDIWIRENRNLQILQEKMKDLQEHIEKFLK
jgi:FkbM family methyltransferase